MLAGIGRLGVLLRDGTTEQQPRALGLVLKRILVGLDGKIKAVEPRGWARPLFSDPEAMMTALQKGGKGTVCCVHALRAHNTQYPTDLFQWSQ